MIRASYRYNDRRLKNLPEDIKRRVRDAIRETALVDIETEAKLKLTRDRHIDTGRLRASIHTEYQGSQRTLSGSITDDMTFIVGTNVVYAKKIEEIDSYLVWAFNRAKPILKIKIQNALRGLD